MPFKLFYQVIERSTRLTEVSYEHRHYDVLEDITTLTENKAEEIHSNEDLYKLLNDWFRYCESGSEGENKAEGHGWYFKVFVELDGLKIDITNSILTFFDNMRHLIANGGIQ